MTTTILLADDHRLMREGLREILSHEPDLRVIGEAESGTEAVTCAEEYRPDLAIVDIAMAGLNGIEAAAQIRRRSPSTAVLILSMFSDQRYVTRALNAGARGYVLKNSAGDELVDAIRALQRGESFFSPAVRPLLHCGTLHARDAEDRYDLLTERERHVYQLLAEGNSNKDIAVRLNLSLHTVETHRARIMDKLEVHSVAELVLSAVRRGLVS